MDNAPKKDRTEAPAAAPLHGVQVGWIVGRDAGKLLVDFEGNSLGPLTARSTVAFSQQQSLDAIRDRRGVVLMFEQGQAELPLIMGLLQPGSETPNLDLILDASEDRQQQQPLEARVDGKRVLLEGEEQVVLRCGEASITLRADGKVVIRGTHLLSRARWANRIKGGSVQIN